MKTYTTKNGRVLKLTAGDDNSWTMTGGKFGPHTIHDTDMARVEAHWRGYCENNEAPEGEQPAAEFVVSGYNEKSKAAIRHFAELLAKSECPCRERGRYELDRETESWLEVNVRWDEDINQRCYKAASNRIAALARHLRWEAKYGKVGVGI